MGMTGMVVPHKGGGMGRAGEHLGQVRSC